MVIENGYALPHSGGKVHTSLSCSAIVDRASMQVVTVEDGVATWRHLSRKAQWCERCPSSRDWGWHARAACYAAWPAVDMLTMGVGTSPSEKIEQYCHHCSTVRECAAFALNDIEGSVGIWGGVFLPLGGNGNSRRAQAVRTLSRKHAILSGLGDAA